MKTKIIPFDLETAKKIQAGEIEGRIVTRNDSESVRIICFDARRDYGHSINLIGLIDTSDEYEAIERYTIDGKALGNSPNDDLVIELPEETPKHEFKVGDCVKVISGVFEGAYGTIYQDVTSGNAIVDIYGRNRLIPVSDIILFNNVGRVKESKKHEFKPFDKVLVRDKETKHWLPRLYAYYIKELKEHCCQDRMFYIECIPYNEKTEHLVGTTDKPKELC